MSGPVVSPKASPERRASGRSARGFFGSLVPSFLAALPLLLALFGSDSIRATRWDAWGIAAWFALLLAAEALPVPLPRGGTMTVASILDIGAIILFGPWVAGALDLLTALPAQLFILRNRPGAAALNAGLYASTTVVAGSAYLAAGGSLGAPNLGRDWLPVLLAGSLYYALNTGWVSLILGARSRESALGDLAPALPRRAPAARSVARVRSPVRAGPRRGGTLGRVPARAPGPVRAVRAPSLRRSQERPRELCPGAERRARRGRPVHARPFRARRRLLGSGRETARARAVSRSRRSATRPSFTTSGRSRSGPR